VHDPVYQRIDRARRFSHQLPVWLALAGIVVAAVWELACPTPVQVGAQSMAPGDRITFAIGPIHQTESEREECYASIGFNRELAFMVAAPPNAIVCLWFRDLAAKKVRGRLVFEIEGEK